jgi:type IV pilus assembly protein PilB
MPISPLRKKYLGEMLLLAGVLTRVQLREALAEQHTSRERLGTILLKRGYVTEDDLLRALAVCFGLPLIKIADTKVSNDAFELVGEKTARKYTVLPLSKSGDSLKIAVADPSNVVALDEIEAEAKMKLSVVLASEKDIKGAIERYYARGVLGLEEAPNNAVEEVSDEEEELSSDDYQAADAAPVVKYVNSLFYEAITKGASDIHIEPGENMVSLRMRLDGKLREFPPPQHKYFQPIVSRVKIMANLDIGERRLPQDGKCKIKLGDKKIDVRVSTLPTIYGEKVVLRVLDRSSISLKMTDIGLSEADVVKYQDALNRPHGMILVTGPTGSGKTTTLYSGLNFINQADRNIVTAEDPVEYELRNVNQVQVRPNIGLTFANVLRSVLRQDPDVIMVGEIRDKETAEIAIQSALTGHLVLSTLHTNDAVSSLSRLRYMNIEPYLIADSVELVMAQRLVRKICPDCKEEVEVTPQILERLGLPAGEKIAIYHGKGCDKCYGTGYRGRTSINEVMTMSNKIKKMMLSDVGDLEIKETAIQEGMRTLRAQAIEKLKAGVTTIEEVLGVTTTM